jgi:hypothetical protein
LDNDSDLELLGDLKSSQSGVHCVSSSSSTSLEDEDITSTVPLGTHGEKIVTFSQQNHIQHNSLRSISLLPVAANQPMTTCGTTM